MNNRVSKNRIVFKTLAFASLLGLYASATADLKMTVSVTGTGVKAGMAGIPKLGKYEVYFRIGSARLVAPNGAVTLFDFNGSQILYLDANKKTYTIESISKGLDSVSGPALTAVLATDSSTEPQTIFGTSAQRISITSQSHGEATIDSEMSIVGSTWFADISTSQSNIGSISPLILIGAPRVLTTSLTKQLDQKAGIPVSLSFKWLNGKSGIKSLDMTVTGVDTGTLDPSLFDVPTGYRQVSSPVSTSGSH